MRRGSADNRGKLCDIRNCLQPRERRGGEGDSAVRRRFCGEAGLGPQKVHDRWIGLAKKQKRKGVYWIICG